MYWHYCTLWTVFFLETAINGVSGQHVCFGNCPLPNELTAKDAVKVASKQFVEMSRAITQSTNVVYVNKIPTNYADSQIRAVLQAYGPLKTFIAPKNGNVPMGFAVCEYFDGGTTDRAIMGLKATQLGYEILHAERISPTVQTSSSEPTTQSCKKSYNASTNFMELSQATVDVVSKEGSLSNHAIFVGLFPSQWNDRQIRKLVEGFGPLRKFITPKYSTNALMGFAVYEYVDSNITDTAVAGLDGTRVGDKMLRAGRIRSSSTREKTAQVQIELPKGKDNVVRLLARTQLADGDSCTTEH